MTSEAIRDGDPRDGQQARSARTLAGDDTAEIAAAIVTPRGEVRVVNTAMHELVGDGAAGLLTPRSLVADLVRDGGVHGPLPTGRGLRRAGGTSIELTIVLVPVEGDGSGREFVVVARPVTPTVPGPASA